MLTKDAPVEFAVARSSAKTLRWQRYVALTVVAFAGLLVRWWLSVSALGFLNGDEGLSALSAFDALHGQPHLIIGASNYGGMLDVVVLAPLLKLFGAHVWLMRIVATAIFAAAAGAASWAARVLFDVRDSWIIGGMLWLMSGAMVLLSITMYLGYNSGLLFMVLSLGLLMRLANEPRSKGTFFAAGITAGIAVWGHPLYVVPLIPAMLALMVIRRADIRGWFVPLAGGAVIGMSPLLIWNAMNGWASILHNPPPLEITTYRQRLEIVVVQLLPRAFGFRGQAGDWLYPRRLSLLAFAGLLVLIHAGFVVLARRSRAGIVVAASGMFGIPLVAAFPALFWSADARYAIVIAVPWLMGLGVWVDLLLRRRRAVAIRAAGFVLLFGMLTTGKWVHRYARVQADANGQSVAMVKALDARGIRGVTGTYWTVYRISFFSNDRIVAFIPPDIAGPNRSTRSEQAVKALPANEVAYIDYLPADKAGYTKQNVAGVDIYFPPQA